jgi:hypothetical protein
MDPIRVPAPPKQSFQKDRPISDLLASQIQHFKHLETKLDLTMPTARHRIATESDAAQYIAEMTNALLNRTSQRSTAPGPIPVPASAPKPKLVRKRTRTQPAQGIPIAAAAAPTPISAKSPSKPKKKTAKKVASKKATKKKVASKKTATTRPKRKQP